MTKRMCMEDRLFGPPSYPNKRKRGGHIYLSSHIPNPLAIQASSCPSNPISDPSNNTAHDTTRDDAVTPPTQPNP